MGIYGDTGGFKWLQGVTGGYRGLQGVTGGYKGLHEVTRDYMNLRGITETFFLTRPSANTFFGVFCIKEKVNKIPNISPKPWTKPFLKMRILCDYVTDVFIVQKCLFPT